MKITITLKATHVSTLVTAQEVALSSLSVVELPIPHTQIEFFARRGTDLIITTIDGEVIVVHEFFAGGRGGHNDLVFQDDDGLWLSDLSTLHHAGSVEVTTASVAGNAHVFLSIDSIEPLLDSTAVDSRSWVLWPLFGVGAGFLVTNQGKGSDKAAPPSQPSIGIAVNDDGSLTVWGQTNPGSSVTVRFPDGSSKNVTAQQDGRYQASSDKPQTSGEIQVKATDPATGAESQNQQSYEDTTAPQAPTVGITVNGDDSLSISGHAEPGSKVRVTFPDGHEKTVTADENGDYSVNSDGPQKSGKVQADATDEAGNTSQSTDVDYTATPPDKPSIDVKANDDGTLTVTGDTSPGSQVKVAFPDGKDKTVTADGKGHYEATSDTPQSSGNVDVTASKPSTGAENSNHADYVDSTAPQAPTVDITVNDDDSLTVSGNAEPGSKVKVTFPDGKDKTVTADENGDYSVNSDGPQHSGKVKADATNEAGSTSGSTEMDYTVGVPTETVKISAITPDSHGAWDTDSQSAHDFVTNPGAAPLILSGTLSSALRSNETLQISLDGGKTWNEVTATVAGTEWHAELPQLGDGSYDVWVQVVSAAGEAGAAVKQTVLIDTTAPSETVSITQINGHAITDENFSNTGKPTIGGTLSKALGSDGGSTETLQISLDGGKTWSTVSDVNGLNWNYTPDSALQDDSFSLMARVVDQAGNQGAPSNACTIHVDTTAPTQKVTISSYTDGQEPREGTFGFDQPTNDTTPAINGIYTGTLAANESVVVYRDDVKLGTASIGFGNTWSYQDSGLLDGHTYHYTARIEDAAGNTGPLSDAKDLTVMTTPPDKPDTPTSYEDNAGPIQDTHSTAASTDDTTPGINIGSVPDGLTPALYVNGKEVASDYDALKGTLTPKNPLTPDDTYHISYTLRDAAGNESQDSGAITIRVDTTAPTQSVTITQVIDNQEPVTGDVGNGGYTNDGAPVLHGTLSGPLAADEYVEVLRDGVVMGTATIDSSGTGWSYHDSGLADDHAYTYTARAVDDAGNRGGISKDYVIHVDTTAPTDTVTISSHTDDQMPVVGTFGFDEPTDDTAPTINGIYTGTLAANESVVLYRDDVKLGAASIGFGHTWSYQDDGLLDGHTYHYTARIEDAAGNTGPLSDAKDLTVIISPSQLTLAITDISPDTYESASGYGATDDFITSTRLDGRDGSLVVKGTVSDALQTGLGETIEVSLDGINWKQASVNLDKSWSVDFANVGDGEYSVQARIANGSGMHTEPVKHGVTVDNTAPDEVLTIDSISAPAGSQSSGFYTSATSDVTVFGSLDKALNSSKVGSTEALQISIDDGQTWQVVTDFTDSLHWRYTIAALHGGGNTVQMRVVDLAGNVYAPPSAGQTITVTPQPSFASFTYHLTPESDDGPSQTDNVTSVVTPTFVGTLSTTDAATLAAAQAGKLTVTLFVDSNGNGIPDAGDQILASTMALNYASGNWTFSVTLPSLAPGQYAVKAALGIDGIYSNTLGTFQDSAANPVTSSNGMLQIVAGQPAAESTHASQYAGLGYAMTAIGDFNGDGYTDYLVSAPFQHFNPDIPYADFSGKSTMYILYGGPNGLPNVSDLDHLRPDQGMIIHSTYTTNSSNNRNNLTGLSGGYGLQGATVTAIGDFNGDGLADVAIADSRNGTIYVLYGKANGSSNVIDLNGITPSQGFIVHSTGGLGKDGPVYLGAGVGGADINGDGYGDLIIGMPDGNGGSYGVIYGGPNQQSAVVYVSHTAITGAANGSILVTTSSPAGLGSTMQAVGDINGDGYIDYVVTAPGYDANNSTTALKDKVDPGSAYLIFGGPNGLSSTGSLDTSLTSAQGIRISASNVHESLGGQPQMGADGNLADIGYAQFHSVSTLGDIAGNGMAAFAIGSPGAINPTDYSEGAGAVYVFYGQPAGVNWSNITLPIWGNGKSDAASNPGGWNVGNFAQYGFVIYSSSFAARADNTIQGASGLGFALSSVGDVNGDGIDDFIIGAPAANGGAGAAFLVFGTPGGLDPNHAGVVDLDALVAAGRSVPFGTPGTAIEYDGSIANIGLGSNLGTDFAGGDFNGSGINSYVVGEWGAKGANGVTQAGAIHIYNGTTAYLTQPYTNGADILYAGTSNNGTSPVNGVDIVTGGQGDDWIHGIGTDTTGTTATSVQHDVAMGGAGDDHIGITGTNFTRVDGGSGWDTLLFEGSSLTLDLAQMGLRVKGFEAFDLNNQSNNASTDPLGLFIGLTQGNTLKLRLSDVLSEPDAISQGSQRMTIMGDSSSTVVLDGTSSLAGSNWKISGSTAIKGVTYDVYHNTTMGSNTVADLLIQHDVHVI